MNAPGWAFNLMVLAAGILLFCGIGAVLALFYWFSPARREAKNAQRRVPNNPMTQRPNDPRPGAFASQGIPRTQSANWRGIPENERGASFFSGRAANVRDMHTTTVSVGGRRRRVLVDNDDHAILQAGMMPPFLMFPFVGGYVPWYAYPDYNPYNDYGGAMPGDYLPYEQVPPQYWEEQPPIADYAYTPDQENFQDYAAGVAIGAMDTENTVAFEDVYRPGMPDAGGYIEPYGDETAVDPLGDPADVYGRNDDPLGDPADSGFDNGDPLGDPADSTSDFGSGDTSSSFDTGGFSAGGFDAGSGSSDAS